MRMFASLFAALLAAYSLPALAQAPLKLGMLLDMSGPYADIGGQGSVTAARMAVEDFGGTVLGRPIEIVFADHQNKADLAGSLARQWFDDQVETILDVAASGPALAVNEIAKQRSKILILNGPAARRLTNEDCGPYTVHYTYDNYALARGTGEATVKAGYDSWFFITADYVFGKDLETITSAFVIKNGGKVVGSVRVPLNTPDFSSFLLQAQASRAKVIGLANSGADTINAIKQAADFGVGKSGQKLVALLLYITDVNALGLEAAQGLLLTEAFYWDTNDETRAWSRRYFDKMKKMPNMNSGRRLFLHPALSQSSRGCRNCRVQRRYEDDEGDPDQRFLCSRRAHPRGRPNGPRHVSIRGEKALRIQGALGRLQARRDHSG